MASPAPREQRTGWDPPPRQGWVAPHLEAEFPGLGVAWIEVEGKPAPSPEPVRRRLELLSDRFYGSHAIRLREQPVPWAYRVFYRQIGIDPDRQRVAVEQLALERLEEGAFKSRGMPADALTIAILETGVTLCALDADRLRGRLCIRDSAPGESLPDGLELPTGTLVLADETKALGPLFGTPAAGFEVSRDSRRFAIVAIQVGSVSQMSIEEALWMAAVSAEAA